MYQIHVSETKLQIIHERLSIPYQIGPTLSICSCLATGDRRSPLHGAAHAVHSPHARGHTGRVRQPRGRQTMPLSIVRRCATATAASVRGDMRHRMGGRGGLRRRGGVTASAAAAEGGPAFKQSVLESRPRVSRNRG